MTVVYAVVCGSPLARDVGKLVTLGQRLGWTVCVVASPDGLKFIDQSQLAAQSGYPVRTQYKNPGDPDVLPPADGMIVAPATVNSVNKLGAGIADTLALGLLVEAIGKGLPIVVMPFTNTVMAAHPAFGENIAKLRTWGIEVLYEDVMPGFPPGTGDTQVETFPWHLGVAALQKRLDSQALA